MSEKAAFAPPFLVPFFYKDLYSRLLLFQDGVEKGVYE